MQKPRVTVCASVNIADYAGLPTCEEMEDELSRQTLAAFLHQLPNFGRSVIAQLPECQAKGFSVVAAPARSTLLLTIP